VGNVGAAPRSVALVFNYESEWVTDTQPQGRGFSALRLAFEWYSALRQQGLDVDIVSPGTELSGYAMALVPRLPMLPPGFVAQLAAFTGPVLIGPRTGSKTADFSIPPTLAPGELQTLLPLRVVRVESLREGLLEQGDGFAIHHWLEQVETSLAAEEVLADGRGVLFKSGACRYLAGWPDARLLRRLLTHMATEAGLDTVELPEGLRLRRTRQYTFAFNYANHENAIPDGEAKQYQLGGAMLPPAGVAAWRR
jgi:beta-galactosidase